MAPSPFRRQFHRPAEVVIGYDEGVLDSQTIGMARDRWSGGATVRTMPFLRAETDPAAPLLVTFGEIDAGLPEGPPGDACDTLARALLEAGVRPLRLMVRFDYRGIIVRGDAQGHDEAAIALALRLVPALASIARDAIDQPLPDGTQLITAAFDVRAGQWVLADAHGFRDRVWRKRLDPQAGWVDH